MDNALTLITKSEIGKSKGLDIVFKSQALSTGIGFLDELFDILELLPSGGGNVLFNINSCSYNRDLP